jgi:hypothetical protein
MGFDPAELAGMRGYRTGLEESRGPQPLIYSYSGHNS